MTAALPEPAEWDAAVAHSIANPTHILGPYEDADGTVHVECDGSGGPYEPSNCGFSTARQPGQVPPDHPDARKPAGWGEHPRDCDCGECP